jgi:hypothetical protein
LTSSSDINLISFLLLWLVFQVIGIKSSAFFGFRILGWCGGTSSLLKIFVLHVGEGALRTVLTLNGIVVSSFLDCVLVHSSLFSAGLTGVD